MLFYATKFVANCYSSNRQLHTYSLCYNCSNLAVGWKQPQAICKDIGVSVFKWNYWLFTKTGWSTRFGMWNIVFQTLIYDLSKIKFILWTKIKDSYDNRMKIRANNNENFVGILEKKLGKTLVFTEHLLCYRYHSRCFVSIFLSRSWNNMVEFILLLQFLQMRKLISETKTFRFTQ